MWIRWVGCIIHCSNACFTIIYIVFSVNFFYYSQAVHLKMLTQDKLLIRATHTHYITKWGGVRQGDQGRSQRPTASLWPSDLWSSTLKSHLLLPPISSPSSPSVPSRGMLSAHYPTLPTQNSNGSKCKRSALNLRPNLHMTPVSSAKLCFLLGPLVFH